jgi:hypothetical protein
MYLTTHLVRSRLGDEGINAFLHHHGGDVAWPADAAGLPESRPGRIVRSRVDLPPGANHVRAYLDVLAPDGTPRAQLEQAVAALGADLHERRNPTVFTRGPVTIRFGVEPGLERIRDHQLDMLVAVAWSLVDELSSADRHRV